MLSRPSGAHTARHPYQVSVTRSRISYVNVPRIPLPTVCLLTLGFTLYTVFHVV